ncbi:MAG: methanol--corrinoid methyltransferase [Candidatus Marinimicrobia bacterium]|nr:methanol--corrinoid methyltransferase [Candidatus Neomarinimicrobiota bacterium]
MDKKYKCDRVENLAVDKTEELLYGVAPKPVTCGHGLILGGGKIYPEINFTLPTMIISEQNWSEVLQQYREMLNGITERAVELEVPGLVVEFEQLPPMTLNPEWGAEITAIIREILDQNYERHGLRSVLRVTPVDIRDKLRPPLMRSGQYLETMLKSFELGAKNGADLLAIESTGGKEIHDDALMNADLQGIIFALGVLAPRDVYFLWDKISEIANSCNIIASGDTACGFANTAMILADKRMIPAVLAAIIRVISTVRTLQAHFAGAVGPTKDCAYEGPYIKAITGVPISMEGKSSACAHLSPIGNITAACADLWSNESVNNVRLLSGYAPVVSLEQLIYDCRLMNVVAASGREDALRMRNWLVESDIHHDPQAYVLSPEVVIDISRQLIKYSQPYEMALAAADLTLKTLREANAKKELNLPPLELKWLDILAGQFDCIPDNESGMLEQINSGNYSNKFIAQEYSL